MRQAFVYLTLKCNNHCKMCYMHEHYSKKLEMDYEDVRKLLVQMKKDNIQKITFLGGEPTLYSRLKEILLYTKELEFPFIRIQTNGQFGKEFLHDHVIQDCVDAFTFSLDGHTEELNSLMREGSDFDLAVSNIRASLKLGKKIAVNVTVSHINIDYLEDICLL